jgi:hypothetical protein
MVQFPIHLTGPSILYQAGREVDHSTKCTVEMVRIVNGEIIQDNDPRLQSAAKGVAATTTRRNNVRDLFTADNERTPMTPNNPSYSQRNPSSSSSAAASQSTSQNPLDLLAKYLKIEDRLITIPAVTPVGLTESKIGLIYLLAFGLLCLFFGTRAFFFGIFAYVFYKFSEKK